MRYRAGLCVFLAASALSESSANAQGLCSDLVRVIDSGRYAFNSIRGSRINAIEYDGGFRITGAVRCQAFVDPPISHYTCLMADADESGLPALRGQARALENQISACLLGNDDLTYLDIGRRRYRYDRVEVTFGYDQDETALQWSDHLHSRDNDVNLNIRHDQRYELTISVDSSGLDLRR